LASKLVEEIGATCCVLHFGIKDDGSIAVEANEEITTWDEMRKGLLGSFLEKDAGKTPLT
jgi:hypothetical protein